MFVRNHLIPASQVVTVNHTDSLKTALDIMEQNCHDALPVFDDAKTLVGIISKQYIYKIFFMGNCPKDSFITNTPVGQVMKKNFKFVFEQDLIEAAIRHMTKMRMQFIVVFDSKNRFSGILTRRNLLEAMGNALGIDKKGVRVEVVVNDLSGRLAALTKVIAKAGYNIMSIIMIDPNLMSLQKVVMRIDTRDEKRIVATLNEAGFRVLASVLE